MENIWSGVGRFFGPNHNDRFAEMIGGLTGISVECAAHFRKTVGADLDSIIAYDRKADRAVDGIHELPDDSFVLRFDVHDAMQLTDEIDNAVDGMPKVPIHRACRAMPARARHGGSPAPAGSFQVTPRWPASLRFPAAL